jgi:hypothetical protein
MTQEYQYWLMDTISQGAAHFTLESRRRKIVFATEHMRDQVPLPQNPVATAVVRCVRRTLERVEET